MSEHTQRVIERVGVASGVLIVVVILAGILLSALI